MQPELSETAPAKVNLFLHVVGRRADGFHLLDSLAVFAGIGDLLQVRPAAGLTLELAGPFAAGLRGESDNLVLKAARALAASVGGAPGAAILLDKRLPLASGIGGGSADAAATLRLLSRLWPVDPALLVDVAERLGADVPVCLASQPARMGGIGERLTPAPVLPAFGLVLVNPGRHLATAAVFGARAPSFSAPAALPDRWATAAQMASDLAGLANDLKAPATMLCPEVADVLAWLRAQPGCLLARMSGSGATCFGVFADPAAAARIAAATPQMWWGWGGGTHPA